MKTETKKPAEKEKENSLEKESAYIGESLKMKNATPEMEVLEQSNKNRDSNRPLGNGSLSSETGLIDRIRGDEGKKIIEEIDYKDLWDKNKWKEVEKIKKKFINGGENSGRNRKNN